MTGTGPSTEVFDYIVDPKLEDNLKYVNLDSGNTCPLGIGLVPKYLQEYAQDRFSDLFRLHGPRKAKFVTYENQNKETGTVEIDTKKPNYATRWTTSYSGNVLGRDDEVNGFQDSFWGLSMEHPNAGDYGSSGSYYGSNSLNREDNLSFNLPYQFQPFETYVKQAFSDVQSKFRGDGKGWFEYNQIVVNWFEDGNDYIPLHSECTKQSKHKSIVTIFLTEALCEDEARIIRFIPSPTVQDNSNLFLALNITTINGAILTTGGKLQDMFLHADLRISDRPISRAMSITFRSKPSDSNSG